MGDVRFLIIDINPKKAVPLPDGDGELPGHGAEGIGFQVDVGEGLALGIEDMDPDVLAFLRSLHLFAQVALEQDGLGLERVAGPVGAPVLVDASIDGGGIVPVCLGNVLRPVNAGGLAPPFSDPRLQGVDFLFAYHLLEVGRQGSEAVQGYLPLEGFPFLPEAYSGRRERLSRLIISHIYGEVVALAPHRHRDGVLLVGGPCRRIGRGDGVGSVREFRHRRHHRVQDVETPVTVPQGDIAVVLFRLESQCPSAEIPADQDYGVVPEPDVQ